MNKDIIAGNWARLKGKFHRVWGRMWANRNTEEYGREEELLGHLQARYGWAKQEVRVRVQETHASWQAARHTNSHN